MLIFKIALGRLLLPLFFAAPPAFRLPELRGVPWSVLKEMCATRARFADTKANGFIRLEGYSLANDEEGTLGINFLPINEDDC